MKKAKRYDRKNLKKRLACIMMIYLEGLNPRKKDKMNKYLDDKLKGVVDYYVSLLKKKNLKEIGISVKPGEIEKMCPEIKEGEKTESKVIKEPVLQ